MIPSRTVVTFSAAKMCTPPSALAPAVFSNAQTADPTGMNGMPVAIVFLGSAAIGYDESDDLLAAGLDPANGRESCYCSEALDLRSGYDLSRRIVDES